MTGHPAFKVAQTLQSIRPLLGYIWKQLANNWWGGAEEMRHWQMVDLAAHTNVLYPSCHFVVNHLIAHRQHAYF